MGLMFVRCIECTLLYYIIVRDTSRNMGIWGFLSNIPEHLQENSGPMLVHYTEVPLYVYM